MISRGVIRQRWSPDTLTLRTQKRTKQSHTNFEKKRDTRDLCELVRGNSWKGNLWEPTPTMGRQGSSRPNWLSKRLLRMFPNHPEVTIVGEWAEKAFYVGIGASMLLVSTGVIGMAEFENASKSLEKTVFNQARNMLTQSSKNNTTAIAHSTPINSNANTTTPITSIELLTQVRTNTPKQANSSEVRTRSTSEEVPFMKDIDTEEISGTVEYSTPNRIIVSEFDDGVTELKIEDNGNLTKLREHDAEDTSAVEWLADGDLVVHEKRGDDKWYLTKLEPTQNGFTVKTSVETNSEITEIIHISGKDVIYTRSDQFGSGELRRSGTLELIGTVDRYLVEDLSMRMFNLSLNEEKTEMTIDLINHKLEVVASTTNAIPSPYTSNLAITINSHGDENNERICISLESQHSLNIDYQKNTTIVLENNGSELKQIATLPVSGLVNFLDEDTILVQHLAKNQDENIIVEKEIWSIAQPDHPTKMKEQKSPTLEMIINVGKNHVIGMDTKGIKTYWLPRPVDFNPTQTTIFGETPVYLGQDDLFSIFESSFTDSIKGTVPAFHNIIKGSVPTNAINPQIIMEDENSGQRAYFDITPDQNGHFNEEVELNKINFSPGDLIGAHGLGKILDAVGNNFDVHYKIIFRDANDFLHEKDIGLRATPATTFEDGSFGVIMSPAGWYVKSDQLVYYSPEKNVVLTFGNVSIARLESTVEKGEKGYVRAAFTDKGNVSNYVGTIDHGEDIYMVKKAKKNSDDNWGVYMSACGATTLLGVIGLKRKKPSIFKQIKDFGHSLVEKLTDSGSEVQPSESQPSDTTTSSVSVTESSESDNLDSTDSSVSDSQK
jgi:hypothetical protein